MTSARTLTVSVFMRPPAVSGSYDSTELSRSRSWVSMDFTSCSAHGLGQVADQVREVVQLHVFGGGQQLFGVHALDHRLAHVFAQLDQHVAFDFRLDEVPDHLALRGRQRLDQVRDLRRVHGGDHARRAAPRTFAQRAAQRGEPTFLRG